MRIFSLPACGILLACCVLPSSAQAQNEAPAAEAPAVEAPAVEAPAAKSENTEVESSAPTFYTGYFQESDGAMPLVAKGDHVDAYFATKALLVAHHAGIDIREAGEKWVNWLLPRQKADGRFMRYDRQAATDGKPEFWKGTAIADADDALMALWIELLYTLAPDEGLPAKWERSIWLAGDHLATLRDERGIYLISRTNRVGLLMDNVEIYGAFQGVARERLRLKLTKKALETATRSGELGEAIRRTFWNEKTKRFRVSTQVIPGDEFYPHALAQIYPLITDLRTPGATDKELYSNWIAQHGHDWLHLKRDEFPWGLVALLSLKMGDTNTANAWRTQHQPIRFGAVWTVLDEAIYQGLEVRLPQSIGAPKPDARLMPKPVAKPVAKPAAKPA